METGELFGSTSSTSAKPKPLVKCRLKSVSIWMLIPPSSRSMKKDSRGARALDHSVALGLWLDARARAREQAPRREDRIDRSFFTFEQILVDPAEIAVPAEPCDEGEGPALTFAIAQSPTDTNFVVVSETDAAPKQAQSRQ